MIDLSLPRKGPARLARRSNPAPVTAGHPVDVICPERIDVTILSRQKARRAMMDGLRPVLANPEIRSAPAHLSFSMQVLDGFALLLDGRTLVIPNRRARALLAYLTVEREPTCSRERLAGLLWSDMAERNARNSLRQLLFELRAALGPACGSLLRLDRETVSIARDAITLDLHTWLARLEDGVLPDAPLRPHLAERLLAGFEDISPLFAAWLEAFRNTSEQRLRDAFTRGCSNARLPAMLRRRFAEAALTLDPTDEGACRVLMRLSAEAGETGVALRAYEALYSVLGSEHDTEPSAPTQRLVADIKRGLLDPPAEPGAGTLSNASAMAATGTPFFGSVPVVAVMPFRTFGPRPVPAYLPESLMEDVVCVLASLREPVVLSSCSTRAVQGTVTDIHRACQQLGAQYYVTGTIRLIEREARISVELADVASGAVVWGQVYTMPVREMLDTQAIIAARVAQTLAPRVGEAELRRSRRCCPEDLNAYQLLLQARDVTYRMDPDSYGEALPLLQRAAALDPGFSAIHAGLANWYCLRIFQGWSPNREADTQAVLAHARTALRADPGHPRMLALLGHTRMLTARRYDEALQLHGRALESSPNDSEAWMFSSATYAYLGQGQEAVRRAERAVALSPCDPLLHQYEHYCCIAHYAAGDYATAAKYGLSSFERNENLVSNLRMTAAALAALGRSSEARDLSARVMRLEPEFAVGRWIQRQAFQDDSQRQQYGAHLIEAGLPP